ncbi:MAG: lipid-A-disaccharide synthase [Rhodobacteraceae bacterium]|nr:lipid-A-disaccharide synthase [Paracoccaceae bacterium]
MKIFLVAGEPSGDRLGAALMAGLKALAPQVEFTGVGGPAMAAEGLQSLFAMEELAVMGLAEVLPRLPRLLHLRTLTARAVAAARPDALVTIDSPDFCLRVAARARALARGLRTIHYVAPSVWAWRPGRAAKMARHIDHVLTLLPFEPPYMHAAGMGATFVGHPVVAEPRATAPEAAAFRARHSIAAGAPLALVLPGSRAGEVGRLAPIFGATLARLAPAQPGLRVAVPTVPGVAARVRAEAATWPGAPVVLSDAADKRAAFAAATAALAASGTVSLELAANGVPMVIGYRFAWLTWQILRRRVRLDTATLVNIVSETRAVPECLGPACTPACLAPAFDALLRGEAGGQRAAMATTMARLGQGGEAPGLRAARAVLAVVRGAPGTR